MSQRQIDSLAQVGDFEVRLLRVFKAVVECGGFTAAVPTLGIGRSAISLHMRDLEERIDLKLCQRGRAGFALTDEGSEVYQAALQLLAGVETFRTQVNSLHRQLRGELNIGITDNLVSLPHMRITDALAELKTKGPDVQINIRMIAPGDIETGVVDGSLHVGVVPKINTMSALDYWPLYYETAYLYCAADHPFADRDPTTITDEQLAQTDAVVPAHSLPLCGARCQKALNATATATDREGIAFLILTGRYIGYLPGHFALRWVNAGELQALHPAQKNYRIEYVVISRHGRRPHRVLETFLEEFRGRTRSLAT